MIINIFQWYLYGHLSEITGKSGRVYGVISRIKTCDLTSPLLQCRGILYSIYSGQPKL